MSAVSSTQLAVKKCFVKTVGSRDGGDSFDELWDEYLSRNKKIVSTLIDLAKVYRASKDVFRARTYSKAATAIGKYPYPILSGSQLLSKKKGGIKGVGKSVAEKIDEIIATSTLSLIEKSSKALRKEKVLELLRGVHGIGEKKAEELYSKGVRSLEDLASHPLTDAQVVGLKYYNALKKRIPREEIEDYVLPIIEDIARSYKGRIEVVGSFRRGAKTSGDIDLLTTIPVKKVVDVLVCSGIIIASLSHGPKKFMGIAVFGGPSDVPRRIDIRYTPSKNWGFGLLHATGSDEFNRQLRVIARDKGYRLSENGMVNLKTGKVKTAPTEEECFEILGIKYVPPESR